MRNENITYIKALAIILMVVRHSYTQPFVSEAIDMFHMPLFFMVSGYCLKEMYFDSPHQFVWKRIKGLWWPYVKYATLFILLHNTFFKAGIMGEECQYFSTDDILIRLRTLILVNRGGDTFLPGHWFLRALFYGSLFSFFTLLILKKISVRKPLYTKLIPLMGGAIMLFLTYILSIYGNTVSVFWISAQQFLAATFFCIGYGLSFYKVDRIPLRFSLPILVFLVGVSQFNYMECHTDWYDIQLILPYVAVASLSTWCIYSLPWNKMNKKVKAMMSYIGNNTLHILIWHALSFRIVSWFLIVIYGYPNEMLKNMTFHYEMSGRGWLPLYVMVGVGMPLLFAFLCKTIKLKIISLFKK